MKTLILYESNTGFTKQYALWIAEAVGGDVAPLHGFHPNNLAKYQRILFGGWLIADRIQGLQKFLALCEHPTAVFAVGATPPHYARPEETIRNNAPEGIP